MWSWQVALNRARRASGPKDSKCASSIGRQASPSAALKRTMSPSFRPSDPNFLMALSMLRRNTGGARRQIDTCCKVIGAARSGPVSLLARAQGPLWMADSSRNTRQMRQTGRAAEPCQTVRVSARMRGICCFTLKNPALAWGQIALSQSRRHSVRVMPRTASGPAASCIQSNSGPRGI